jgi:hypothetical protein
VLKGFIIIASLAASSVAMAAPAHLTDSQYLSAVRCRALIASPSLGKGDTSAIDAMLKVERNGRQPAVADRADEVRSDTVRVTGHAGANEKAQLMAERNGVCQAIGEGGTTTAAAQIAQPTGAN